METRNASGTLLSSEIYEDKEELRNKFAEKLDDNEVAEIKVTKDIPIKAAITDMRRKVVHKQMRKLQRKLDVLTQELK